MIVYFSSQDNSVACCYSPRVAIQFPLNESNVEWNGIESNRWKVLFHRSIPVVFYTILVHRYDETNGVKSIVIHHHTHIKPKHVTVSMLFFSWSRCVLKTVRESRALSLTLLLWLIDIHHQKKLMTHTVIMMMIESDQWWWLYNCEHEDSFKLFHCCCNLIIIGER